MLVLFYFGCFECGEKFGCVGAMVVDEECLLEMSMYVVFNADRPGDRPGPAVEIRCEPMALLLCVNSQDDTFLCCQGGCRGSALVPIAPRHLRFVTALETTRLVHSLID